MGKCVFEPTHPPDAAGLQTPRECWARRPPGKAAAGGLDSGSVCSRILWAGPSVRLAWVCPGRTGCHSLQASV